MPCIPISMIRTIVPLLAFICIGVTAYSVISNVKESPLGKQLQDRTEQIEELIDESN